MRDSKRAFIFVIGVASVFLIAQQRSTKPMAGESATYDMQVERARNQMFDEGKRIFRFDTFGDEAFWGGTLRLHQAIAGAKNGGVLLLAAILSTASCRSPIVFGYGESVAVSPSCASSRAI